MIFAPLLLVGCGTDFQALEEETAANEQAAILLEAALERDAGQAALEAGDPETVEEAIEAAAEALAETEADVDAELEALEDLDL